MKYVHIPIAALQELRPYHVTSFLSEPLSTSDLQARDITGTTEWGADWKNEFVSVRWMWGVVRNIVIVLDPSRICTNIQLTSRQDLPEPRSLANIYLLEWIESLPWRETGIGALLPATLADRLDVGADVSLTSKVVCRQTRSAVDAQDAEAERSASDDEVS
jgi:hypothetical protein